MKIVIEIKDINQIYNTDNFKEGVLESRISSSSDFKEESVTCYLQKKNIKENLDLNLNFFLSEKEKELINNKIINPEHEDKNNIILYNTNTLLEVISEKLGFNYFSNIGSNNVDNEFYSDKLTGEFFDVTFNLEIKKEYTNKDSENKNIIINGLSDNLKLWMNKCNDLSRENILMKIELEKLREGVRFKSKDHLNEDSVNAVGSKHTEFCPNCGGIMVIRKRKLDNALFAGCINYPYCKGTKKLKL